MSSSNKSTPFTKAAATMLVVLLALGWVTWKFDDLKSRPGSDDVNARFVEYKASTAGTVGSMWADVQFFDGTKMVFKADVELPVTYEVVLSPGQIAKMVVESSGTPLGGELNCDLYIEGTHAAFDGDNMSFEYPNVECAALVS